jgi:hypothetical protein
LVVLIVAFIGTIYTGIALSIAVCCLYLVFCFMVAFADVFALLGAAYVGRTIGQWVNKRIRMRRNV